MYLIGGIIARAVELLLKPVVVRHQPHNHANHLSSPTHKLRFNRDEAKEIVSACRREKVASYYERLAFPKHITLAIPQSGIFFLFLTTLICGGNPPIQQYQHHHRPGEY
jgi:hypothetical protein